jgi:hypothetical protein
MDSYFPCVCLVKTLDLGCAGIFAISGQLSIISMSHLGRLAGIVAWTLIVRASRLPVHRGAGVR